jgi:hypothetical protein
VKNVVTRNLRLKERLQKATQHSGLSLDTELQDDLLQLIDKYEDNIQELEQSDFRRIFWEQQISAIKATGKQGIRWHPFFIRWCLNIMQCSPKAYNAMRESNLIILPSQRTLKDYTHWFRPQVGYQVETFTQLYEDFKVSTLTEAQQNVVLVFDEMKIHEGLVFDNQTELIIGFVDTGDLNKKFKSFEAHLQKEEVDEQVATHILAVCVRGIFMKLEYPLGHFPTKGISAEELYNVIWKAVRLLMEIELKVVLMVSDGMSTNRKFFKFHKHNTNTKNGVVYKVRNLCDPSRTIWFMSDVCHLLKTTRNCWEHSSKNGTRHLEVNGYHILWSHLISLYEKSQAESGLYIGKKLKLEHVKLNPFSRMNVRLAAQVLSKSVADLFKVFRECEEPVNVYADTTETERFCRFFNRFFDCLNTRNLYEGKQKRNDDLLPYTSSDDIRLKWLENDFLSYLEEWSNYAQSRIDVPAESRKKMMLSAQTLEGLKMTVYSFIEVVPYLLSLDGAEFILSERFNQDTVESYFAQQRARCGRGDNPAVQQVLYNSQSIRTSRTLASEKSSNIQKRKLFHDVQNLSEPLRKKRRTSSHN